MKKDLVFPFGSKLKPVLQKDKTPKKVFVLGVYASAIHAKWIGSDGKIKVRALAIASEPYIFWRGESADAEKAIAAINMPKELGRLVPADGLNGPSGLALDNLFLAPLGYKREDAWLCDLLPYACINPSQRLALDRAYEPLREQYNLPEVTIGGTPKNFADDKRVAEILIELKQSEANKIVLLGDMPIKYFLSKVTKGKYNKLSDFGTTKAAYGKEQKVEIDGKVYSVIALAHPRQAGQLGRSSKDWFELHSNWVRKIK